MSLPDAGISMPAAEADAEDFAPILDRLGCCIEAVSLDFDGWGDAHTKGPGLYFVVARDTLGEVIEPMGRNRWPIEDCETVFVDDETLIRTARSVARSCDGAVVVHPDGTFGEAMVRVAHPPKPSRGRFADLPYADWMGARHMSALETSAREAVAATLTLSEEDGRMTVFRDGRFEDFPRASMVDEPVVCD